jgi:hypothetical protein
VGLARLGAARRRRRGWRGRRLGLPAGGAPASCAAARAARAHAPPAPPAPAPPLPAAPPPRFKAGYTLRNMALKSLVRVEAPPMDEVAAYQQAAGSSGRGDDHLVRALHGGRGLGAGEGGGPRPSGGAARH